MTTTMHGLARVSTLPLPAASSSTPADAAWPLGRAPEDYVLGHVTAVLPDSVIDDARVVVRSGRIVEVSRHPSGSRSDVDGRGAICLPGIVDVHGDALARELRPRPGASVPVGFALASLEGRLGAAGITTAFHGIAYQARSAVGLPIGSPGAEELVADLELHAAVPRVLHRLDVRCPDGVAAFEARLASRPDEVLVVSHEDHTPGQGQYADPATMQRWLMEGERLDEAEAAAHVEWWRASRDERIALRDATLDRLGELARAGRIRLFGHDPETREDVDGLAARGAAVAEFPTTRAAAERARELGLLVVAGAPNVLRGGSHAGNVSAGELVDAGLVDALASDYLPSAQLAAAFMLARAGRCTLARAVELITAGPAKAVGLDDRGSLRAGQRADLVLVDADGPWPHVIATMRTPDDAPAPRDEAPIRRRPAYSRLMRPGPSAAPSPITMMPTTSRP
ncbi:alpha-D-ribose 1-methylphosphonate 5-triphosphate diphosphatase [Agromyces salentinus]|uniref:Alpha-D-ribose 1-methylphosphonate 5-triphosphate diphosphatase n=1 Tax=Agromyces salentinus TaxID=269421 RepID=A0ABP4YRQ8_9MICO|nr:alpha-D-ribose 1-methylphosphonate 5-triphosphate diphosphatase [Agromyces salentinus]